MREGDDAAVVKASGSVEQHRQVLQFVLSQGAISFTTGHDVVREVRNDKEYDMA